MNQKVVIIGGNATGMKTAAKLRRLNKNIEIVVFTEDEYISYAGCGLTYYISNMIDSREKIILKTPEKTREEDNIIVYNKHRVERIDTNIKQLLINKLDDNTLITETYDTLVIATGSVPIKPKIKNINANNVFFLKTISDAEQIKSKAKSSSKAIIIGGGYISLELSEAFKMMGLEVTVISSSKHILNNIDPDISFHIKNYCQDNNINIVNNETVITFIHDENNNITGVITNKQQYKADLVVISKGFEPNADVAFNAGIKTGINKAIVVNEYLETSVKNVYAGGDCIEITNLISKEPTNYYSGSLANKHGNIIAQNISGIKSDFKGSYCPSILKIKDMTVAKVGLSETEAKASHMNYETVLVPVYDTAHYYPGSSRIIIKLLANKETHKLLGVQIFGLGNVSKRIDIASMAMYLAMSVDCITKLDITYAPPYSGAIDAIIIAANVLLNKLNGSSESILPLDLLDKLNKTDTNYTLIDVRSRDQFNDGHIPTAINLSYDDLTNYMPKLDRNKEIITYCVVGRTSYLAYKKLINNGFANVKYLEGGITTWIGKIEN